MNSEWIKVEDALPSPTERVWVFPQEVAAYYVERDFDAHGISYKSGWYSGFVGEPFFGVTHWMHLPKPPDGGKKR